MTTFSIGIPAFKSIFLKECIDSILSQNYANFELIIINDCSPYPIKEIVSEYTDERIRYFENIINTGAENVVDNWNKCLEKSTGDYFILMGDDDKLDTNYLEEFINLIRDYPNLGIYHCRSKIINEESVPVSITTINPKFENVYDFILSFLQPGHRQFISDFVYRADELKSVGGFYKLPHAWASDYLSALIACRNKGIAHTNQAVFNYRTNRYSITSSNSLDDIWSKSQATIKYAKWIREFLKIIPSDPNDMLKHSSIITLLDELVKGQKATVLRQILGRAGVIFGLIFILKSRQITLLNYKNVIAALAASIVNKLHK
jgi:glycosyltransferase involved in cell wall biosynthesis